MKRFSIFAFSLFCVLLFSCGGDDKPVAKPVEIDSQFVSEKIMIDLNFPEYQDTVVKSIMNGLGLCELVAGKNEKDTVKRPPCDHSIFRVFMNHRSNDWKEGFLIEVRAGIYSKEFRVINVSLIEGKYKVTNDYAGELLEMRTTPEGNYDMIIRYKDGVVGTVAIYHEWKVNHYEPITVVELNDHFVKQEKMDSLNKVYIDNFSWGF